MRRRVPGTLIAAVVALAAFGALTALVTGWDGVDALDARLAAPLLAPGSAWGQLLAAVAIVTSPTVQCVVTLGLAYWAATHRLRRLAVAMVGAVAGGLILNETMKRLIARPRPESLFADTLVQGGFAYPSGHVTGAVIVALMAVTLRHRQRRSWPRFGLANAVAVATVAVVAFDRWAMGAHHVTDVLGGTLWGLAVGWASLVPGSGTPAAFPRPAVVEPGLPAVVYNPAKFSDLSLFRRRLDYELRTRGWREPVWLETTTADPGAGLARSARAKGADLVVAAGGDGTLRAVCEGLLGSATPIALLPSGTGNILAHNLGIPLDQDAAFAIALDGRPRALDLIRLRAPGFEGLCAVMSGMGVDAAAMAGTRPDLKKLVGNAAYIWSILRQLRGDPFDVAISLDGREPVTRCATMAMVGNVGGTQTPLQLFPAAKPDDGLLDLLVNSAVRPREWATFAGEIIAGSVPQVVGRGHREVPQDLAEAEGTPEPLEYAQAKKVRFETDAPVPFEVDGDAIGSVTWLEAEVLPGAVRVVAP